MNKLNYKKAIFIVLMLIVIAILPNINMYYQKWKVKYEKLPNIYKNRTELDSLKDNYYEVIQIVNDSNPLQINDSTIVIFGKNSLELNNGNKSITNTWYKINLKGQVKDSLKFTYTEYEHNYRTFNNYIVDVEKNTYNNWINNGDTVNHSFKCLNEKKIFSIEETEKILKDMQYIYSEISEDKEKYKLIVFKNNIWNYFYTEKEWEWSSYHSDYTINEFDADYYYPIEKPGDEYSIAPGAPMQKNRIEAFNINDSKSIIHREYVHKDKWIGGNFWNISEFLRAGNNSGGNVSYDWYGTCFLAIKMPMKKLYYKQKDIKITKEKEYYDTYDFCVYKPKDGEYLLLFDNSKGYLIRPK
jgi:hypothetical protein